MEIGGKGSGIVGKAPAVPQAIRRLCCRSVGLADAAGASYTARHVSSPSSARPRNQGRLTKHRTDPAWARVAVYLLWLTGFTLVFAVGGPHKRLGQLLRWTLDLPSHPVLAACITSSFSSPSAASSWQCPPAGSTPSWPGATGARASSFSSFSIACVVGMLVGMRAVDLIWNQDNLPRSRATEPSGQLPGGHHLHHDPDRLSLLRPAGAARPCRRGPPRLSQALAGADRAALPSTPWPMQSPIDHDPATAKLDAGALHRLPARQPPAAAA